MLELVLVWIVLLAICVAMVRRRRGEGALLLAYFLGLSLIHVPGAVNVLGNVVRLPGAAESLIGFRATLIGIAALLLGAAIGRALLRAKLAPAPDAEDVGGMAQVGRMLLAVGVATNFVLLPLISFIPSITALTSAVSLLLIVGYWMMLKSAMDQQRRGLVLALLAASALMPIATLSFGGFAGYGISWMLLVASFYLCNARRVALIMFASPFAMWFGISLAVAYFEQRKDIRISIETQGAGLGDRFEKIYRIAENFEVYSFNNGRHVFQIDRRLNQNFLVGLAIQRHEAGVIDLFHGSTVSPLALIPRAIWPDKPQVGGGGNVVSAVTGIIFDKYTSVGAGQPLEFYANFAWPGLVGGFLLLGGLLAWCDKGVADGFRTRDIRRILIFGLPGIAMIQPGGNLIEIIVSAIGAMIMAHLIVLALARLRRPRRAARRGPMPAR